MYLCVLWMGGRKGEVELFNFPFLCGFQTQSSTALSQLKLSISQGPKGESWLLGKATHGRGWNDLVHHMGIFSPTPFLWVQWSQAAAIFFSDTAISPSDAWVRQQRGGGRCFLQMHLKIILIFQSGNLFPDDVKITIV